MVGSHADANASKVKVLHVDDIHFGNVLNCLIYLQLDRSHIYSGVLTAYTVYYDKRKEAIMHAYKFNGRYQTTILRFLAQSQ